MHEPGTQIPDELTAGDTWEWTRSLSEFPASEGWVLSYALRGPTGIDITATAEGDGFRVKETAQNTASLDPGRYRWAEYVTKNGDRHEVNTGHVLIRENLATAVDRPSHARKMVAALEAALEGKVDKDTQQLSIAGRSITRMEPALLRRWLGFYRAQLIEEQTGKRFGRKVGVRFV